MLKNSTIPFQLNEDQQSTFPSDELYSDPSEASQNQIQLHFQQQSMSQMSKFDIDEVYSNQNITEANKYRSDFCFLIQFNKRGKRHLIAIQKSQIIWTILKIVSLSFICYYIYNWIQQFENILPWIKQLFLWSTKILPFLLLLVSIIDPGFILDHEIYQNEYQHTGDKKRPKDGKYCEYCRIFTKRKTHHCYRCGHCVNVFDHHCSIMTRCVGQTNVILFYGFVLIANSIYMGSIGLAFYEWVLV